MQTERLQLPFLYFRPDRLEFGSDTLFQDPLGSMPNATDQPHASEQLVQIEMTQ